MGKLKIDGKVKEKAARRVFGIKVVKIPV